MSSWRLALRVARREALRARGRSLLVLVMIALPVLAVTAADIVIATQDVSSVESLDRRLGSASAEVSVPYAGTRALQGPDPDKRSMPVGGRRPAPTEAQLADALGGARLLPERRAQVDLRTDDGVGYADATEVDLTDPLADGLFRLTAGRWPSAADEVVVNQAALDKGYGLGDVLGLRGKDAPAPTIVGVAESTLVRDWPAVAGPPGSLGLDHGRQGAGAPSWLVDGRPVPWSTVRTLNALGAVVLSRAVVEDPPPESALPAPIRGWGQGADSGLVAAVVLIVVMALLEVVLLAGPAFAVSARRLARSLALMAAAGGTPAQSRRVVIAGGVVLGTVAAALGVVLGIGVGRLVVPLAQRRSGSWFGPFDVPWTHLAGIAAFGLVSAVLAAVVPAWIASRQDVVAVLAGRRADGAPSLRSPVLGTALLGVGIAGSAYGTRAGGNGPYFIAGSAVVAVLGMILLVPVVVVGVARLASRLPLSARYAARDAARHRTRTVPAVAAVAATVAGVVALGIVVTSDEAENEATYSPSLPLGVGAVTVYGGKRDWAALTAAVETHVPGAEVSPVHGLARDKQQMGVELRLRTDAGRVPLESWSDMLGSSAIVDDGAQLAALPGIPADRRDAAARVLAAGGAVAFADAGAGGRSDLRIAARVERRHAGTGAARAVRLPGFVVRLPAHLVGPQVVLSPAAADRLGLETTTSALVVTGTDVSEQQEGAVSEAVTAVSRNAGFYVERGYQPPDETAIIQLVLGGLGAVLMLGGTLTATFLALSDARPDLATLAAVGASPRRRRSIAASYALVVGFVGAALGAAVGFIPGVAITYPLTNGDAGPFLDVPWLLVVGLVVGLPLVTALVVGLAARSRLPLAARLD